MQGSIVRPFLPYATVRKWLLYGPQIPPLTRAYIGYLDFLYGES